MLRLISISRARVATLMTPTQTIRYASTRPSKFTTKTLAARHRKGAKITMCTAYDYTSARIVAGAGTDMVLVGDSYGNVMLGYSSTASVTMDDMKQATATVARTSSGHHQPLIVGDMPFGSYLNVDDTLRNAADLIRCGAHMVKLEGGAVMTDRVSALVANGMPVCGHLGVTPQTAANSLGGFAVQGAKKEDALQLLDDALALQEAGCSAVVLEMVVSEVAKLITEKLSIPTIGIGAGPDTSGQVLVFHDLLGMFDKFTPKFVKQYAQIGNTMADGLNAYNDEVRSGVFPAEENTARKNDDAWLADLEESMTQRLAQHGQRQSSSNAFSHPQTRKFSSSTAVRQATPRKVVVVGGGALGSLYAGVLTNSGVADEVFMVTSWQDQVDTVTTAGLTIDTPTVETSPVATHNVGPVRAVHASNLDEVTASGPADLVLILVKSVSTGDAAKVAEKVVAPNGMVLTLQNGMGNVDVLQSELGSRAQVVGGVTDNGVAIVDVGHISWNGIGRTRIALPEAGQDRSHVMAAAALLEASGLKVELQGGPRGLEHLQWAKLVVNAAINPVTALLDAPNGQVKSPPYLELASRLGYETVQVAKQSGIQLAVDDVTKEVERVATLTSQNISSMLSDVRRGVPTEVDQINGFVVRQAQKVSIPVPANRLVVDLVRGRSNRVPGPIPGMNMLSSLLPARQFSTSTRSNLDVARGIPMYRSWRSQVPSESTVGFVPTMGALHQGHLQLMESARQQCDLVVASIFVNPLQFAAHEDLDQYPMTLDRDLELCAKTGVDVVFLPERTEMYPADSAVTIKVGGAADRAEGASRPHFFDGVATICTKLFNIVNPHSVYFGQKDAQQCATIKQLVRDLNFNIDVVIGATTREEDGLAMSSRNLNLTPEQRLKAPALHKILGDIETKYKSGERRMAVLLASADDFFSNQADPVFSLEYLTIADSFSMSDFPKDGILPEATPERPLCVAIAAKTGHVRLIDNILMN